MSRQLNGGDGAADSSDIQGTFDDEFKDTFVNYPKRPPKRDHSPPNIYTEAYPTKIPNPSVPDYAVFVNAPTRVTSRKPVIQRPPPRHPGVQIPGVEHPPDSGSIQDIIEHIDDDAQDKVSNANFTPDRHITQNHFPSDNTRYDDSTRYDDNNRYDDYHPTPVDHGYPGYRPPIGYKGPSSDYHTPTKYTHDSSLLPDKYPPVHKPTHYTEEIDYHPDPEPTYYEPAHKPEVHAPAYPSHSSQYNPLSNTYEAPAKPISYSPPYTPPEHHEQSYYPPEHKPHVSAKPYIPPYQPEPYHKPIEKPIPPVEEINKGPVLFNSLINPPGPDIFDGQSLYGPPPPRAPASGYQGDRKSDFGQTEPNYESVGVLKKQRPTSSDDGYNFYNAVNKVESIVLQENTGSGGPYNNNNNNYQYQGQPEQNNPPKFSPYDQHAKGSKYYVPEHNGDDSIPEKPTSNINLNAINSYTSMGANSNVHANLQGSPSSHGISPYTYTSGRLTFGLVVIWA